MEQNPIKKYECFCGSTEYKKVFDANYNHELSGQQRTCLIARCRKCGLNRTLPPPFENDATAPEHQFKFYKDYKVDVKLESKEHSGFDRALIKYIKKFKKFGKLLDIGCSTGHFLLEAQDAGYDVEGVEVDTLTANFAAKERKLKVIAKDFVSAKFKPSYFDIIVANHTLEHIVDLKEFLDEASRVLKPGGIFVVSVPNFGGLYPKVVKDKWYGLQPDGHVWHFTPKTLRRVLNTSNLRTANVTVNSLSHKGRSFLGHMIKGVIFGSVHHLGMGDQLYAATQNTKK